MSDLGTSPQRAGPPSPQHEDTSPTHSSPHQGFLIDPSCASVHEYQSYRRTYHASRQAQDPRDMEIQRLHALNDALMRERTERANILKERIQHGRWVPPENFTAIPLTQTSSPSFGSPTQPSRSSPPPRRTSTLKPDSAQAPPTLGTSDHQPPPPQVPMAQQQQENEAESAAPIPDSDEVEEAAAATRIQAHFRGHQLRKTLEKPPQDTENSSEQPTNTNPSPMDNTVPHVVRAASQSELEQWDRELREHRDRELHKMSALEHNRTQPPPLMFNRGLFPNPNGYHVDMAARISEREMQEQEERQRLHRIAHLREHQERTAALMRARSTESGVRFSPTNLPVFDGPPPHTAPPPYVPTFHEEVQVVREDPRLFGYEERMPPPPPMPPISPSSAGQVEYATTLNLCPETGSVVEDEASQMVSLPNPTQLPFGPQVGQPTKVTPPTQEAPAKQVDQRAKANQNIKEFAKDVGLDGQLVLDSNGMCVVGLEEDLTLLITFDPQTNRLYLYSTLATELPENKAIKLRLYEELLEGALLGRDMAGGNVGVSVNNSFILMASSIDLPTSASSALRTLAPNFIEACLKWRAKVNSITSAPNKPPARKHAWIGLEVTDGVTVDGEFKRYADGVVVVNAKASAQRAGIQPNDVVITVAGSRITSLSDFQEVASRLLVGEVIEIAVDRLGRTHTFEVPLGSTRVKPGQSKYRNIVKFSETGEWM
eukprot:NODE_160_length_2316_cov_69.854433_g114_i0.p1 GENE.NODE_160_length_2316_cov_69.854433_g114_i0~~NODE_160_length_2316_cov_69.854433_g114_i0.p1  ORF type:complete len:713 (+),score=135.26 NODE_160_length_2316_cov_69.854433_g114_i0:70-2208(+)